MLSTKNDGVQLTGPYRGEMRHGTANGQVRVLP
jgi:hypothetical protein